MAWTETDFLKYLIKKVDVMESYIGDLCNIICEMSEQKEQRTKHLEDMKIRYNRQMGNVYLESMSERNNTKEQSHMDDDINIPALVELIIEECFDFTGFIDMREDEFREKTVNIINNFLAGQTKNE